MNNNQVKKDFYFRTLVQNSQDMIIRYNNELEVIYYNQAVEKLQDTAGIMLTGKSIPDPDGEAPVIEMQTHLKDRHRILQECLKTAKELTIREYLFFPGDHRHLLTRIIPEVDIESGNVTSLLAVSQDITDLRHNEKRGVIIRELLTGLADLVDLNDALRFCLDKSLVATKFDSGGIYIRDEESGALKLAVHRGLSETFKKKVSNVKPDSPTMKMVLTGQPIYDEYHNLGIPIDEVRRKEGLKAIAVLPIFHSQRCVACLNLASHTTNEIGEVDRVTVETIAAQIGGVITRIKAEEKLWERNEFINKIISSLPDVVIYIFDLVKKKNIYASSNIKRILGYSVQDFQAMDSKILEKTIHPDDLQPFYDHLKELEKMKKGEIKHFKYRMKHRDGHWVWIENRDTIFTYNKDGKPIQTIGTAIEKIDPEED